MKPLFSVLLLALLVGCASASPPSGIERALYNVTTNYVTNVTHQVQVDTNRVVTNIVAVTNVYMQYQLEPKQSTLDTVTTASSVATTAGVGWAGLAGTFIASLLYGWAEFRNRKKATLNTVFAQNIETAREVIKAQPNGLALDSAFMGGIKSQQVFAGVKAAAAVVADEQVNTVAAKESADRIMKP